MIELQIHIDAPEILAIAAAVLTVVILDFWDRRRKSKRDKG